MLAQAGPRITRLTIVDSPDNLLAETPDIHWPTAYGEYYLWGGHRLWRAPEIPLQTYVPETNGLSIESLPDGVHLFGTTDAHTGIRKSLEIHLHPHRPTLMVIHHLHNEGPRPVSMAAWAITQLPLGGVALLPQPRRPLADNPFAPNRLFVFWPYACVNDSRLEWGDDLVQVHGRATGGEPFKLGCFDSTGWCAYLRRGTLFVKRFDQRPDCRYADFGCNVEVYVNDGFLELETLGPLEEVPPGASTTHVETWEVHPLPTENALPTASLLKSCGLLE